MGEEVIVCSALTIIVNYHSEILHTQQSSNGATSNPTKESEKDGSTPQPCVFVPVTPL